MKKLLTILACGIFTSPGVAGKSPFPVPPSFMFEGKPISPACVDRIIWDNKISLLDKCQMEKKSYDPKKMKEGWLGYSTGEDSNDSSYIYYKYLGVIPSEGQKEPPVHLIFGKWSGGGTGHFTTIAKVQIKGHTLKIVDSISSGDRCNGGIVGAEYTDGTLTYTTHQTPSGLYGIVQKLPNNAFENMGFAYCAICCIGKLTYQGSDIASFTFDEFASDGGHENSSPSPQDQACYTQIIKETTKGWKYTLTPDELKSFTDKIKERCVDKKAPPLQPRAISSRNILAKF